MSVGGSHKPLLERGLVHTAVKLHLVKNQIELTSPFLELRVPQAVIPQLIQDLGRLGRYMPLAVVINDHIVTGLEFDREGVTMMGQPMRRIET